MKLNATLLLQLINFILLYWILRTFFLRQALTFFFNKREEKEKLQEDVLRLEKKALKTEQAYTELITTFKEKMAAKSPTITAEIEQFSLHTQALPEKNIDPEHAALITKQLRAIIEKECHHES